MAVALMSAPVRGQGPPRELSGRVIDAATGLPVVGAAVTARGSVTESATSAEGNFRLRVPVGAITITVHCVGYEPVAVAATGDQTVV
ncbi:MAG: carboxypeptidase regulatory-like domain-containing protein, partial [Vulcanimicrobiaceae bacterium]